MRLCSDLYWALFRFLDVAALFATRSCSRALRERLSVAAVPAVWRAVRPPRRALNYQLTRPGASPWALELLRDAFGYSPADLRGTANIPLLYLMCARGELAAARWLAHHVGLVPLSETVPSGGGRHYVMGMTPNALVLACEGGHLAVIRWLASAFRLSPGDARAGCNAALVRACQGGHLAVVQWLVEYFRLTVGDLGAPTKHALLVACGGGHLQTVQWLTVRFGLTAADARADAQAPALVRACSSGNLALVEWLVRRFGLGAADVYAQGCQPLRESCLSGRLDVARWLVARFAVDVRGLNAGPLSCTEVAQLARAGGAPDIARWLKGRLRAQKRARPSRCARRRWPPRRPVRAR
jgi:hypothetical protein